MAMLNAGLQWSHVVFFFLSKAATGSRIRRRYLLSRLRQTPYERMTIDTLTHIPQRVESARNPRLSCRPLPRARV